VAFSLKAEGKDFSSSLLDKDVEIMYHHQ